MPRNYRSGQAVILVVVATSIFILGALGLAVDGAHMFAQLQMAQVAADSGAQAGVMTMFDGTDISSASPLSTSLPFTCTTTDTRSPCKFVRQNGFGSTSSDTVTVDNPGALTGVKISNGTIPLRVTVSRTINTTLIRFLGPATSTIQAKGIAAIVDIYAPVPILVTHPSLDAAFNLNGTGSSFTGKITICGGPGRSIQVNSSSIAGAVVAKGNPTIDLSHAGPLDPGDCSLGTGADFGTFGAPSSPPFIPNFGVGQYVQPSSPIDDPLRNVAPPPIPSITQTGPVTLNAGATDTQGNFCSTSSACDVYSPGYYASGIAAKGVLAFFQPGIYYMGSGGFSGASNSDLRMSPGPIDTVTGAGMLIYDTGPLSGGRANSGGFSIGANGAASLVGSGCSATTKTCDFSNTYQGILAFEDRNAVAHFGSGKTPAHKFGGGGAISLIGTLYITPTKNAMRAVPSVYQETLLQGNPGSSTLIEGEIITSVLSVGGNGAIQMNLNPGPNYIVRQVALVK